MLWPGIKKLGKQLNLMRSDTEVTGRVRNCFVRMYDGNQIKVLELYAPNLDSDDKDFIIKRLDAGKIKKYEWPSNGVKIIFQEYLTPYSTKKIKELLDELVKYFSGKYPDQSPSCQYCGEYTETEIYCVNNTPMLICGNCYRQHASNFQRENEEIQNAPNNYLMGFIGALLFAVPGILITIGFFLFLDSLGAVSAVAYIFLGILGYKKFKGKISHIGAVLITAAALIMVGAGIFVSYSALIFKSLRVIDFDLLALVYQNPEIQKEFIQNLMVAYLVSAAYFIFQFFQLRNEWKGKKSICKPREI